MSPLSVDVLTVGPAPADPYDPAAGAWALSNGLARRGHRVRVVHPAGEATGTVPPGVEAVAFPALARHLGSAQGDAEIARAAGRHVNSHADLLVRDPLRPGPLGVGTGPRDPPLLACVRGAELDAFDGPSGPARGWRAPFGRWRGRTALRRLEAGALAEASRIACETDAAAAALVERYGLPPSRVTALGPSVQLPDALPSRAAARARVGVPVDDPLVAVIAARADPKEPSLSLAREAFVRLRPIFAGAHGVFAGVDVPGGNGIAVRPARDAGELAAALAAADVAVFLRSSPGFDPGVAMAFAVGCAPVVTPSVTVPPGGEPAVRRVDGTDPGELASVLAELLADPAARRTMAEAARDLVALAVPERAAAEVERIGVRRSG